MNCKVKNKIKKATTSISPFNSKTQMPAALFIVKKVLSVLFCYVAGMLIAEILAIVLHFAIGYNVFQGEMLDFQTMSLIKYYGYIVFIAVVLLYWHMVEKKPLAAMGVNKTFGTYVVGAGLSVFLLALCVGGILLSGHITYEGLFERVDVPMLLLFMGGFVVQGAMEEVLCRGLLLHALKEKIALPLAVLISTVVFILPHGSALLSGELLYGAMGVVNLALISVVFSLLTIQQKNIWAACGLHSFWNAILYSVLGLNLSGNDEISTAVFRMRSVNETLWNGGPYGIEASAVTTIWLGSFAVLLWLYIRKKAKKQC